ncbi:hypothetical protein AF332_11830 [Sporosarcina globispora]|uniref:Uncharacterized protein n=1 Tax=Sporosarcina globispora TaxID=1459 RepID=A0A0M0GCJ3_SPOGL|nr:hypothetical protein [Sporosarcina globispora]KON87448.1 hypothetical protein AF332_11830 [Sporosarcina globispora]
MSSAAEEFSAAFINCVNAKRKLIKENIPYYIKVNPNYFNTFINERQNSSGEFSYTYSSDGSHYVYHDFLDDTYEVPLILDDNVESFKEVFKTE